MFKSFWLFQQKDNAKVQAIIEASVFVSQKYFSNYYDLQNPSDLKSLGTFSHHIVPYNMCVIQTEIGNKILYRIHSLIWSKIPIKFSYHSTSPCLVLWTFAATLASTEKRMNLIRPQTVTKYHKKRSFKLCNKKSI